ncbi:MAG: hypothetical protein ABIR87_08480 [Sphingomicrobium sp.]
MTDVLLNDVIRNPEWLPHTFTANGDELIFVDVPRAARNELRFLFDEHFADKFTKTIASADEVAGAIDPAVRAPINFIFHTSFCGSSLLARALEIPGTASSMREPAILINLANRLIKDDDRANADRLEVALRLLERPFAPGESVVSKQSNFANRVIEPMLRARPESRAVLLHSDLDTYLISLLKRGMWGRILGRKLFTNMTSWSKLELGMSEDEILELTDMQVAAMAYLMQIHHFHSMVKAFGPRVMMLDSSALFGNPAATLHRIMTFFDFGLTEQDATAIANGPIFAKHSKFADKDYSVEERQRDTASVGEANAEELAMVSKWIAAVAAHHGISLPPRTRQSS